MAPHSWNRHANYTARAIIKLKQQNISWIAQVVEEDLTRRNKRIRLEEASTERFASYKKDLGTHISWAEERLRSSLLRTIEIAQCTLRRSGGEITNTTSL